MKLFGLAWTDPNANVRCPLVESAEDLGASLLLMQYDLPPTKPLPWWIVDFSGHMQRFDGFPKAARFMLPAPPVLKAKQIGYRPKGEILPPEPWNYKRIWITEEIQGGPK